MKYLMNNDTEEEMVAKIKSGLLTATINSLNRVISGDPSPNCANNYDLEVVNSLIEDYISLKNAEINTVNTYNNSPEAKEKVFNNAVTGPLMKKLEDIGSLKDDKDPNFDDIWDLLSKKHKDNGYKGKDNSMNITF